MPQTASSIAVKQQESDRTTGMKLCEDKVQILDNFVTHENHTQVQYKQTRIQNMLLTNQYAVSNGNQITKITEIQLEDRIIKIVDRFVCSSQSGQFTNEQMAQGNSKMINYDCSYYKLLNRKANIFHDQNRPRDTKNVVKNIVRLFNSFLHLSNSPELQLSPQLSEILNRTGKYNNSLIVKIVKHQQLRKAFLFFANNSGQKMIDESRIVDKQTHYDAMKKYTGLCRREEICEARSSQSNILQNNIKCHKQETYGDQQQKYQKAEAKYEFSMSQEPLHHFKQCPSQ